MPFRHRSLTQFCLGIVLGMLAPGASPIHAGSATWLASPATNNWNSAANWTAGGPPNGTSDTANFSISNQTMPVITATTQLNGITFLANASPYTISINAPLHITINGAGVTNNSGSVQNIVVANNGTAGFTALTFFNNATAGSAITYEATGATAPAHTYGLVDLRFNSNADHATFVADAGSANPTNGGDITVREQSTANHAVFIARGATVFGGGGGEVTFFSATADHATFTTYGSAYASSPPAGFGAVYLYSSDAANASFTNNGGTASGACGGQTNLAETSTAGHATFTNNPGTTYSALGGMIEFSDTATADHGVFTNQNATAEGALGGKIEFHDDATAGNGAFINKGSPFSPPPFYNAAGTMEFRDASSAGSSSISVESAAEVQFYNTSTASEAVISANGGIDAAVIAFRDTATADNATMICGPASTSLTFDSSSSGGNSRVELFGNAILNIDNHQAPGVTIGSLEGDGDVSLGSNTLQVGGNNLDTSFAGTITGDTFTGALVKVGTGTFGMSNPNTYNGGTTIAGGTLAALHDGALGGGNVALFNAGTILTLQGGSNNDYISDNATLTIAAGATVNLNFSGNPDTVSILIIDGVVQPPGEYGSSASGAARQLPIFAGSGRLLITGPVAFSRKTNSSGTFDIYLPMSSAAGIECRSGGPNNQYQLVVTFLNPVDFNSAIVTSGQAAVAHVSGTGTKVITVDLANVSNAQFVVVTLFGIQNPPVNVRMRVLIGDTSGNGAVNASDVSQTKAQSGQLLTSSNARMDVNANGSINASDVSLVKSESGTSLP